MTKFIKLGTLLFSHSIKPVLRELIHGTTSILQLFLAILQIFL